MLEIRNKLELCSVMVQYFSVLYETSPENEIARNMNNYYHMCEFIFNDLGDRFTANINDIGDAPIFAVIRKHDPYHDKYYVITETFFLCECTHDDYSYWFWEIVDDPGDPGSISWIIM